MKAAKIVNLSLSLLFLMACDDDQISESPCPEEIDEFLLENYSEDAKYLLFSEILSNTQHPDRNQPEFSQERLDTILQSLQSVYNLKIPERDSVFEFYKIHVFPWLGLRSIALKVNPEAEEIMNLVAGIIPTGNSNLDLILDKYQFSKISKTSTYPESPWIYITSTQSYNLLPIINSLMTIHSIIKAEQSGYLSFGDENDIRYSKMNEKVILDFKLGDCWSGCAVYRRHWIFEIDNPCKAIFKESYSY